MGCSPWGHQELDTTERLHFHALEKEMATHSSVLAWRILGTVEPGGLPSMGSQSQTRLKRLSSSSSSIMYTVSFQTTEVKFYANYMESQVIIYSHYTISFIKLSMHPYLLILKNTLMHSNFSDWANFQYEQPYFLFCTDCVTSNYTFLN